MKQPRKVRRVVGGRYISLRPGICYLATAPMNQMVGGYDGPITVSIYRNEGPIGQFAELEVGNFTKESATKFLREFNNRRVSFMGRKWAT